MSYWSKNTGTHPTSLTETDPALDTNGIVVGVHSEEPALWSLHCGAHTGAAI